MFYPRALVASVALCLAGLFLATAVQAQSLGEIAAAEAKRRAAAAAKEKPTSADAAGAEATRETAPKKAYTNKDLVDVPSQPAAVPPEIKTEPVAKDTPNKTATEKVVSPVRDEAWWKTRMAGLRANLDQATNARLAKAALVLRLELVRDNVPDRGFSVAQAYAAASSELAKARADLEICIGAENAAKAAITDAEEDARVHGVLPGWLR